MPVFDPSKFLKEWQSTYNIPEEAITAAEREINGGFLRQDEFSRRMDEVRKAEQEANDLYEQNRIWYETNEGALKWAAQVRERFGDLDNSDDMGGGVMRTPSGDYVSKQELEAAQARLAQLEQQLQASSRGTIEVASFLADVAVSHRDKYGKPFDQAAFRKFAETPENAGKYADLYQAYRDFSAEDAKALEDKKWAEREKQIREEERQNVLSQRNAPVDTGTGSGSLFYSQRGNTAATPAAEPSWQERRASVAQVYQDALKQK